MSYSRNLLHYKICNFEISDLLLGNQRLAKISYYGTFICFAVH
jgi:hypothetical protein